MARLARNLEKQLYARPVQRIIVKTQPGKLMDIATEVKDLLPDVMSRLSDFAPRVAERLSEIAPKFRDAAMKQFAALRIIPRLNYVSFPASSLIIEQLAQDGRIQKIYPDREFTILQKVDPQGIYTDTMNRKLFTSTFWTKKLMGGDQLNKMGYNGEGVHLAVLDTGGSRLHRATPHLRMITEMKGIWTDENGHGEWCAAAAAGKPWDDPVLNVPTEGFAPDCDLLSVKVLGYVLGFGSESGVVKGMVDAGELGSDVLSMSLGSDSYPDSPEDDPQVEVIEELTKEGRIVVVAAGNAGPDEGSVGSPGVAPDALTVGAWDAIKDELARFSSRGPPKWGGIKPDVVAPGVNIDAPTIGILDTLADKRKQRASYMSGTSMSTPCASGFIVLLKQLWMEKLNKNLTTFEVKRMMQQLGGTKNNQVGWGFLNLAIVERWLSTEYSVERKKK